MFKSTRTEEIMKRIIRGIVCMASAALLLCACGKTEDSAGETAGTAAESARRAIRDLNPEDYVTVGEYKGLEVTIDPAEKVPDEMIEQEIESSFADAIEYGDGIEVSNGIKDRAVKEGDIVYIDYEGKLNGEAFEGGTAKGHYLEIGGGRFIEGFEEGLIGVMPGETVELPLTFPDNYYEDLAGKDVIFTVTVHYILPEELPDELLINFCKNYMGLEEVESREDFEKVIRKYYESEYENAYETELEQLVMDAFMENVTVNNVPEDILGDYLAKAKASIDNVSSAYGMEPDEFLQSLLGMGMDEYLDSYRDVVSEYIACQYVANKEGINPTDEELNEKILEEAAEYGYASVEEYLNSENSLSNMEDYREFYMYQNVVQLIKDNAVIHNN